MKYCLPLPLAALAIAIALAVAGTLAYQGVYVLAPAHLLPGSTKVTATEKEKQPVEKGMRLKWEDTLLPKRVYYPIKVLPRAEQEEPWYITSPAPRGQKI